MHVFEGDVEILCFSRHADGYPAGLGAELRDFCASKRVVNGISSRYDTHKIANGAGCLAALLIAHFKDGVGGIYVHAPGPRVNKFGYEYNIRCPDFETLDAAAKAAPFNTFTGLPIVVDGFDCYRGLPLTDPGEELPDEDDEEDEADTTVSKDTVRAREAVRCFNEATDKVSFMIGFLSRTPHRG